MGAGCNCMDYSTLAVSNASIGLASASPVIPSEAKGALITVETDQIRWRADGSAPTSTEGHLLNVYDTLQFDSWTLPKKNWRQVLNAIRFIRVTNDAKLKITWFD